MLIINMETLFDMIHMMFPYGSVSKPCTPGEHQNSW